MELTCNRREREREGATAEGGDWPPQDLDDHLVFVGVRVGGDSQVQSAVDDGFLIPPTPGWEGLLPSPW
jgi:hypothetical protein